MNLRCIRVAADLFQSRCRDWVVGEIKPGTSIALHLFVFQSRCRDWVVGEEGYQADLVRLG